MPSLRRVSKVESEVLHKLSTIISRELRDPRLDGKMYSIGDVQLSRDFSVLKVYVFINESEDVQELVLECLNKTRSFLRKRLGAVVRLRKTPEIRFYHDETPERAARINGILHEVIPEEESPAEEVPSAEEASSAEEVPSSEGALPAEESAPSDEETLEGFEGAPGAEKPEMGD